MKKIIYVAIMVGTLTAHATPIGGGTGRSDAIVVSNSSACESLSDDKAELLIAQSVNRATESACSDFPNSYLHIREQNTEEVCTTRKNIKTTESSTTVQFVTHLRGLCL